MITLLGGEARVVAAISSMKGNVQIHSAQERKYESAYKGQMIRSGDWINTDLNVFVAIVFLDGSNIKIRDKTEIEIKSSRVTAKQLNTRMYIAEGQVWNNVTKRLFSYTFPWFGYINKDGQEPNLLHVGSLR